MARNERGVTLVELAAVLSVLVVGIGLAVTTLERTLALLRADGGAQVLYGAIHLTKARARATGVMHALVIERNGRGFRIVENPTRAARTVVGPVRLMPNVRASANTTIRFSPKGFAVPMGTVTVRADTEVRRVIVNIVGRVRIAKGEAR